MNENMYRVDGSVLRAPNHDPVVPAAVAPLVSAITGLDGAMALAHPNVDTPPAAARRHVRRALLELLGPAHLDVVHEPVRPGAAAVAPLRLPPSQIDSAYGIDRLHAAGLDGRGQTIAITGAFFSPTIRDDVAHFSHRFHLDRGHWFHHHGSAGFDYREIVAPGTQRFPKNPAETQSWYIEQALDVEWAHAVAPAGEDRLRRRRERRARPRPGAELRRRQPRRRRHLELVGPARGVRLARRDHGPELGVPAGGRRRAPASTSPRATTATTARSSARARRASPTRARGSRRSAARASASARTASTCGRPAGARRRPTGTTTTGSPRRRGRSCTGRAAAPSHVFAMPAYQAAEVPPSAAMWNGKLRRVEPDIVDGRRPADRRHVLADLRAAVRPPPDHRLVDRRHQPLGAAPRGHHGARRPGRRRAARLHQPHALPDARDAAACATSRAATARWPSCETRSSEGTS